MNTSKTFAGIMVRCMKPLLLATLLLTALAPSARAAQSCFAPVLSARFLTNATVELRWLGCTNAAYQVETSHQLPQWQTYSSPLAARIKQPRYPNAGAAGADSAEPAGSRSQSLATFASIVASTGQTGSCRPEKT